MNSPRFSSKKLPPFRSMTAAVAVGAAAISSAPVASAAVVVVDIPDAQNVIFSHLGVDEWSLTTVPAKSDSRYYLQRNSGDGFVGSGVGSITFTTGADIVPLFGANTFQYADSDTFRYNGATIGINYARLDLDADSVYETVIEFDIGPDAANFSDDSITRYAYDDGGADLNISPAVAALNPVPEPSSALLFASSAALCFLRRRR